MGGGKIFSTAKKYGQTGLSALCAAGLFSVLYWMKGLYPFGGGSIMMTDMYSQYVPLLYRFYDVVTGQKNLFVDLRLSGGANLYVDTINEVLNPFNYILLLFGREMIYKAVNVVLLCYVAGAAAAANLFLLKVWPERRSFNVALSLCYALSGYLAYNFQIIKWMYLPVVFPLFALALLRLLEKKKGGLYALLLAWQLILSVQMGFMTLLFVLFSSGLYLVFCVKKQDRARRILSLGWHTLGGILLACPVLVPNVFILLSSSRAGENMSYFGVMKQHGLDDLFERIFQIGHPALLGMGLYLLAKRLPGGRKRGSRMGMTDETKFLLSLNGFLWLTVLLQPANLLWHMGSYVCFPVRYAYMVLLCEIGLIKQLLTERETAEDVLAEQAAVEDVLAEQAAAEDVLAEKLPGALPEAQGDVARSSNSWISGLAAAAAVLAGAAALVLTLFWEERLVQAFSTLAISRVCRTETLMCCVILAFLVLASFCAMAAGKLAKKFVAAAVLACGLCMNLCNFLYPEYAVRQENEAAYEKMTLQAREAGGVLDREKEMEGLPLNASFVNGQSTLTGYMPTASKFFKTSMEELGYLVPWVATQWIGGTEISDDLMSMALVLEGAAQSLQSGGDGTQSLQPGSAGAQEVSVLSRQKALALLAAGEDVLDVRKGAKAGENGGEAELPAGTELTVEGRQHLYLDAGIEAGFINVFVNGDQVELPEAASAYSPHRILDLGIYQDEAIGVSVTDTAGNPVTMEHMEFGLLDYQRWEKCLARLEQECLKAEELEILEKEGKIRVHLSAAKEGQTLFLPFAAIEGWSCERNGKTVDIEPVLGGFLGITLLAGENEIEIVFCPKGFGFGCVLFVIGAVLWVVGIFAEKKMPDIGCENSAGGIGADGTARRMAGLQKGAAVLYGILLAAGILVIYVLPAFGMIGCMALKVLGRI